MKTVEWKNISGHPKVIAERRAPEGVDLSDGGGMDVPRGLEVRPDEIVELPAWVSFSCDFERVGKSPRTMAGKTKPATPTEVSNDG